MEVVRPLYTPQLAEHFVTGVLEITDSLEIRTAIKKIVAAEMELTGIKGKCTHESDVFLDMDYKTKDARRKLHDKIIYDLTHFKRLDNDELITLGHGGALPKGNVIRKKQAIIVTGLPASGKSTITNTIADEYGAYVVDCDYAKRKLPEFADVSYGANLVHEESSQITIDRFLAECVNKRCNMVIPKIGYSLESIELGKILNKEAGYDVHLVLVSLDRQKAAQRAYKRFIETGRYVPLSLIFDKYANDPILTYYRAKNEEWLKSWGKVSTDVWPPVLVEAKGKNPANLFKEKQVREQKEDIS